MREIERGKEKNKNEAVTGLEAQICAARARRYERGLGRGQSEQTERADRLH